MSPTALSKSVRAALLLLGGLAACTVPTLKDLEKVRVRSCDASHLCASGYTCVSGQCVVGGAGCSPGATQACGSSVGECVAGEQTCGNDGTFGACVGQVSPAAETCDGKDNDCNGVNDDNITTSPLCPLQLGVCAGKARRCLTGALESVCVAASYGPDYEPSNETRCDGLDNDCDGTVDEGINQDCALQLGVCQGAKQACRPDGGACSATTYATHSADYEVFETACDGRDNDCDGLVDAWAPQNLSNSPGVVSSRASAARLANGSVLATWQEGQKVRSVSVGTDGVLGTATQPSTSAEVSARAFIPAVASDGPLNWAAWAEEVTAGGVRQVQTAPVDGNGRSTLPSAGAFRFPSAAGAAPVDIAVGVDGTALLALVVVQNGSNLEVASFSPAVQVAVNTALLGAGQRPQVAVAGSGSFWVAFQNAANDVRLCLLQAGTTPITGSCQTVQTPAEWPGVLPLNSAAPFVADVSFQQQPTDAGYRIARRVCDGGTCAAGLPGPYVSTLATQAREASVSRTSGPVFTTWEDVASTSNVFYFPADGGVSARASPALNSSRRPVPVMLGPGRAAVVFDTEGNTAGGFPADEVVLQRLCVP